jgi:hypothetical protein
MFRFLVIIVHNCKEFLRLYASPKQIGIASEPKLKEKS